MMKLWKNYLPSLKLISSILLLLLLLSCREEPVIENINFAENIPDEQADSLVIFAYNGSVLDYQLRAQHLDKFYDMQITLADTVYIETYDAEGLVSSSLYCDKAELDETKNLLTGYGNVVIQSENGILKTPYIIWDRNTDIVTAKKGVILIRDGNILKGEELKTDINLNEIEMIKVSAEGTLDERDIDW
jgi:LPS export ABC transporter protein LptC